MGNLGHRINGWIKEQDANSSGWFLDAVFFLAIALGLLFMALDRLFGWDLT